MLERQTILDQVEILRDGTVKNAKASGEKA